MYLENRTFYCFILFLLFLSCKKENTSGIAPLENWTKSSTGVSQSPNDLHFNNKFGIICGDFGTILKTTNNRIEYIVNAKGEKVN